MRPIYIFLTNEYYNSTHRRALYEYIDSLCIAFKDYYDVNLYYFEENYEKALVIKSKQLVDEMSKQKKDYTFRYFESHEIFTNFLGEIKDQIIIIPLRKFASVLVTDKYPNLSENNKCIIVNTEPYSKKYLNRDRALLMKGYYLAEYYDGLKNEMSNFVPEFKDKIVTIPLMYNPFDRLIQTTKKFDVCFVTRHIEKCERRFKIINELKEKLGNKFVLVSGWGRQRDDRIAESKILLNIHSSHLDNRESLRIDRITHNKVIVVSEDVLCKAQYNDQFIIYDKLDNIVNKIMEVLENYDEIYQNMFDKFKHDELLEENKTIINRFNEMVNF